MESGVLGWISKNNFKKHKKIQWSLPNNGETVFFIMKDFQYI